MAALPAPPAPPAPSAQQALEDALATLLATGADELPSGPPSLLPHQALEEAVATLTARADAPTEQQPQLTVAPVAPVAPVGPVGPVGPARVQLGFRDGTSTALDPSSTQSQALEQLAQSLTRRD